MEEARFVLGPVVSLLAWRAAAQGVITMPKRIDHPLSLERCTARATDLRELDAIRMLGKVPLDVIVGNPKYVHRCKSLDVIVLVNQLPQGSFCLLEDGLYVCSPELCFLLLGRSSNLLHLAEIGCELCGTYAMAHDQGGSYVQGQALTNCERLEAYLGKVGKRHGVRLAHEALREVRDGSDSPSETNLFLMLTLDDSMGGYAITKPQLNMSIKLSERTCAVFGESSLRASQTFVDNDGRVMGIASYESLGSCPLQIDVDISDDVGVGPPDADWCDLLRNEGISWVIVQPCDTEDFSRFERKAFHIGYLAGCTLLPSTGSLMTRRIRLFRHLFDERRWGMEYQALRVMAGYERAIRHNRSAGRASTSGKHAVATHL